jgi:hypothetical protein
MPRQTFDIGPFDSRRRREESNSVLPLSSLTEGTVTPPPITTAQVGPFTRTEENSQKPSLFTPDFLYAQRVLGRTVIIQGDLTNE